MAFSAIKIMHRLSKDGFLNVGFSEYGNVPYEIVLDCVYVNEKTD